MLKEDKPIEKVYYTIGEVATMFNLTVSNVRFWETEFDILMPKKNARGDRFFTKKDIENLRLIYHLLKERGYTIEGAKKKLKESRNEIQDRLDMMKSLEKIKSFLVAMKEELDRKPVVEEVTQDVVAELKEEAVVAELKDESLNESVQEINSELTEEEPRANNSLPPISPDLFSSTKSNEERISTGRIPGDEFVD